MEAGYAGLRTTIEFFNTVDVLDFDRAAAEHYADLRSGKLRVGTQDLRIAAITLAAGGILVTRNRRDFERVPRLRVADWSI